MTEEKSSEDSQTRNLMTLELGLRQRAIEASANAVVITSADAPQFVIEYC